MDRPSKSILALRLLLILQVLGLIVYFALGLREPLPPDPDTSKIDPNYLLIGNIAAYGVGIGAAMILISMIGLFFLKNWARYAYSYGMVVGNLAAFIHDYILGEAPINVAELQMETLLNLAGGATLALIWLSALGLFFQENALANAEKRVLKRRAALSN